MSGKNNQVNRWALTASEGQSTLLYMLNAVPTLLRGLGPHWHIRGRIKTHDSIVSKLRDQRLDITQIYDIIGVRAITRDPQDCYRLIRRVHAKFEVLEGAFDDYIAFPKSNGYRSLHTTIFTPCGFPVEIQVRTQAMHASSVHGSSAHGLYKAKRSDR